MAENKTQLSLDSSNIVELLQASTFLELGGLRDSCLQFLLSALAPTTALQTLALADQYSCSEVFDKAQACVRDNCDSICSSQQALQHVRALSRDALVALISDTRLQITAEVDVLEMIAVWLENNLYNGRDSTASLLAYVRLPFQRLQQQIPGQLLTHHSQAVRDAISDALSILQRASVACDSPGCCARDRAPQCQAEPMPRAAAAGTQLVMAGGHDATWFCPRSVELYNPVRDAWTVGPPLPPMAGVSGNLYMLGGRCSGSEGLKSTQLARVEVQSVECLHISDSIQPCWRDLAPMLTSRASHAAAALGSCLYAIGGQSGAATMSSVEQLDVLTASWHPVSPMKSGRKYCCAASLDGRVYVAGGVDHARVQLPTVEAYDPREGRWQAVAPMSCGRSSCGMAALCGSLFVVGGHGQCGVVHDTVEMYDPAANAWLPRAPMGHARCSMALEVL
ncbi:hypothetical protein WJX73_010563 [Symbiochloris irregularis]|uniref:BACK domain-containing protein n=1 Tax=Symbiochloris irregularis TaxID=706552 RepID=A0AAW1PN32_9CHLO